MDENATRRHLKVKTKSTTLFDTDVTEYVHQEITPESALQLKEAEDAAAGFEIFFDGALPEGCEDDGTCLSGADPSATEFLREFAAEEILPFMRDYGGEGGQYLSSPGDLVQVLSFGGTDDVYEILDDQLVAPSTSKDGGRRLASCPNYTANQCRSELRTLTRRCLTISYGAMTFVATGKMADRVMDRFNDNHWCTLEDWFIPLIAANGAVIVLTFGFWSVSAMAQLCVLALATGFAAVGFNGFMSIVGDSHRWYEWVAFSAIWAASTAASFASRGLSTLAAITIGLAVSGPQLSIDIVNYMSCIV